MQVYRLQVLEYWLLSSSIWHIVSYEITFYTHYSHLCSLAIFAVTSKYAVEHSHMMLQKSILRTSL